MSRLFAIISAISYWRFICSIPFEIVCDSYIANYLMSVVQWRCSCNKECPANISIPSQVLPLLILLSKSEFFFHLVDCGAPPPPVNGLLQSHTNTTERSVVVLQCNEGFVPMEELMIVCGHDGQWNPIPSNVTSSPSPNPTPTFMPTFTPASTPNKLSE